MTKFEIMSETKTIRYLKKTLSELSSRYQEYKKAVSPLKQVITELGDKIVNNKLEIFAFKKNGYNGPYEDEEMYRICYAMQEKLLETHTETNFKDFDTFEKIIEDKLMTMDTELQHLQRMSTVVFKQPDPIGNMSEMVKKKQSEIRALKQEQDQLLQQTEDNQTKITTLKHKLKRRKEKICFLKHAYEREHSTCKHILEQLHKTQGECKDLDAKCEKDKCEYIEAKEAMQKTIEELQDQLKETVQEQKTLENNFEKEKRSHKTTKESLNRVIENFKGQLKQVVQDNKGVENTRQVLEQTNTERDRVASENQTMVKSGKELIVQLQNMVKENRALEENYQQEKLKHKSTNELLDHIMKELDHVNADNEAMVKKEKELQVQMQSIMRKNKALEDNCQQEKLKHKCTAQELEEILKKIRCNIIDKLEEELQQGEEKSISLEEKYRKDGNAHGMTREREEKQELDGKYENEKSLQEETQEQRVQANQQNTEKSAKIKKLEFLLQQAVEEIKWTNQNSQEKM